MITPIRILGFAGSLRKNSVNHGLLRTAATHLPTGMTLERFDLSPIPLFNQDLIDTPSLFPDSVAHFKARITYADALLIATPEYNHSISGVLKNALDWVSRPRAISPFNDKPAAIMGAGGRLGTARAQAHMRQIAQNLNLKLLEQPEVLITHASQKFDSEGNLTDEAAVKDIEALLVALAAWVRKLRGEQTIEA